MTILEAYRVLLSVGFEPVNDVEFHWYDLAFRERKGLSNVSARYSAEEGGLLGSQAVAQEYKAKNARVLAQIQV